MKPAHRVRRKLWLLRYRLLRHRLLPHNKRRLIQSPLVAKLAARLKPGGYLHCATDWQPYAEQMLEVLSAEPLLANTAEGYAPRPDYRPLTKFENRGIRLGHGVWDLVFTRR